MGLLALAACGMLVGLLARACVRRAERMGVGTTVALGVAGAFMGAFLTCAFTNAAISELHAPGVVGGVIGAIVLLTFTVRAFPRRGRGPMTPIAAPAREV
jgi:uncharacterized membrane protein YeaQ/YmgE (transglycosylase-associated protein family)